MKRPISTLIALFLAITAIIPISFGEETNRDDVREQIESGGWNVINGDLINEADYLEFVAAVASGEPNVILAYFDDQLTVQIEKIQRDLPEISQEVLQDLLIKAIQGEGNPIKQDKLNLKGGVATYQRHEIMKYDEPYSVECEWKGPFGIKTKGFCPGMRTVEKEVPLPNNHQPYIAFRYD